MLIRTVMHVHDILFTRLGRMAPFEAHRCFIKINQTQTNVRPERHNMFFASQAQCTEVSATWVASLCLPFTEWVNTDYENDKELCVGATILQRTSWLLKELDILFLLEAFR